MDRLDSRTARHVKRMTILKGHVLHGIFHLGLPSNSIDPRLDQCRRLCCDMGSTATFARAERGIAAEQVEQVSHSRPAHSTYHRARTRPPERACGLEVPRSCCCHILRPILHTQLDCLSYLSPTPCLRLINPTRPYPHPLPNPTLALSSPTPIRSSSSIQQPAYPRPPRHQRTFVSPCPTNTTRRPHGTPLKHPPSVQTSMGL